MPPICRARARSRLRRRSGRSSMIRRSRSPPSAWPAKTGSIRLHRAGQVKRQPWRNRRRHGRQGPQGDRRPRNQRRQCRPAGRVHRDVQRGDGVHQGPQREPDPRSDAHSGRARLAAGDGDPRRKVAHRELRLGQLPRTPKGLLDRGDREEVDRHHGGHADAARQLPQLPDEMRGDDLRPWPADLHDEVLLQAHLHDGGDVGPGVRPEDRPARHRVWSGRVLGATGHGLRPRALRSRHPDRR